MKLQAAAPKAGMLPLFSIGASTAFISASSTLYARCLQKPQ
jgi:hypothetical protein